MKNKKITELQLVINNLEDSLKSRYNSSFDYKYDIYKPCQNGSDCCENDYCRCGEITNAIVEIDFEHLRNSITKDVKDQVLVYCTDRILSIAEIYKSDNWQVNIEKGYYGEEIEGVVLDSSIKTEIFERIRFLENLTGSEKILSVLDYEYGYLLPKLKDVKQAEIKEVDIESISFNKDYYKKISEETVDFYKDYSLPVGVCLDNSLIDGYHRVIAAKRNNKKTVLVIILT